MRRFVLFLMLLMVVMCSMVACTRQQEQVDPMTDKMVNLEDIPASYGELVAVTFAPQNNKDTRWREMWFENEETGTITYVPVRLPGWMFNPELVKTIKRP